VCVCVCVCVCVTVHCTFLTSCHRVKHSLPSRGGSEREAAECYKSETPTAQFLHFSDTFIVLFSVPPSPYIVLSSHAFCFVNCMQTSKIETSVAYFEGAAFKGLKAAADVASVTQAVC